MPSAQKINTVTEKDKDLRNTEILLEAQHCWESLSRFRRERERNKRYTYGDQWGDKIKNPDGEGEITEEEYIRNQGSVPLKNNLIRRLIKSVTGQYRNNQTEPVCIARDRDEQQVGEMMSVAMQYNYQLNRLEELDGRSIEEFLISGAIFHKENYAWRKDKMEVWTDMVNPNRIFFDSKMEDTRHWDCSIIGEVHDLPLMQLLSLFAKDREQATRIRDIYRSVAESYLDQASDPLTGRRLNNLSFLYPDNPSMCRVIEVWRKEHKERLRCHDVLNGEFYKMETSHRAAIDEENRMRVEAGADSGLTPDDVPLIEVEWFIDEFWYYRFLSPTGDVLDEGETPYTHREHPYTLKLYPFIDGEVHSFVADVVDQQRYVNRLITMTDFIMRTSAKGVLMFPEELIPENKTPEDILDEWVRYNGVIFYKGNRPGVEMPRQISTNATNVGSHELLNLQMKLMEEVSGVHGAMQGKTAPSGTPASLYRQQTENASINLVDLFDTFRAFREERDTKKMKMIQQFYNQTRYMNIVGRNSAGVNLYDPEKVSNVEFDLSITQSANSPAYRLINNEFLMEIWKMGQISLEQLLQNGNFPFADTLLQSLLSEKEAQQQTQAVEQAEAAGDTTYSNSQKTT